MARDLTLADGRTVTVRNLQNGDISLLMRALPGLTQFANMSKAMKEIQAGVIQPLPEIPANTWDTLFELEAALSGLSLEEVQGLDFSDGVALLEAIGDSIPKSLTKGKNST